MCMLHALFVIYYLVSDMGSWNNYLLLYISLKSIQYFNPKKKKKKQQNRQTKNKLMVQAPTSAVLEALIPIFFSGGPL